MKTAKKPFLKRIMSVMLAAAFSVSLMCVDVSAKEKEFETAEKAAENMRAGICIGCQLDAYDKEADQYSCSGVNPGWDEEHQGTDPIVYETADGRPPISEKFIKGIKDAGYNAVRLPVTWGVHCDKDGNINKQWLDRVQEVVDYILDEDMYCILNMHHDDRWLTANKESYTKNSKRFANIWKNIALRFKNYDEKLIFECYNEMYGVDDSGGMCFGFVPEGKDFTYWYNKYLQLFVDTVRKTGGNNKNRNLLLNTYSAWIELPAPTDDFVLPEDSVKDHLIIGFHYYYYAKDTTLSVNKDIKVKRKWGTDEDKKEADTFLQRAVNLGKKWSAPVVMGEFGAQFNYNSDDVVEWTDYLTKAAKKKGITCFWWDDTSIYKIDTPMYGGCFVKVKVIKDDPNSAHFGLFNRSTGKPVWTDVINTHIFNSYGGKYPAPKLTGKKDKDSVSLEWNAVPAVCGYRVYELDSKTNTYKQKAFISKTTKTFKGLSKGTHIYKVVPVYEHMGKKIDGKASNTLKVTVK